MITDNKNLILGFFFSLSLLPSAAQNPLKIALAGLTHDHVHGILQSYKKGEVSIIAIAESNRDLTQRYKERYNLHDSLFFSDLSSLLKQRKPDAVMAFNAIAEHLSVVEACAPLRIHVMVEKPLAVNVKHAERMAALARQYKIHLLTNYETTWYASNQFLYEKIVDSSAIGNIRKMVVHDGHQGPREIGVSKEFLQWLTDPQKNGGGAVIDFGCYGANLMTWLMKGESPVAVTAVIKRIKPEVYPNVDDDATILLEYAQATGIIEASWNWPFSIKDLEVFGTNGYLQAVNGNTVRQKAGNQPYSIHQPKSIDPPNRDVLQYLSAVINERILPGKDLSSLENNLIVVRILEAAKKSAKEGKRVLLSR